MQPQVTPAVGGGAAPGRPARPSADLARHELRAARVLPLLCAAALATLMCAVPAVFSLGLDLAAGSVLLQLAAVLTALAVAFALDDPAAATTTACPSPWWLRRSVRLAVVLPALAAFWLLDVLLVRQAVTAELRPAFPTADLSVEALALTLVAVALGLAGLRFTVGQGGGLVAAGLLVIVVALTFLPQEAAFFATPDDGAQWDGAAARWRATAAVALIAAALLLPRPPGRRR
ncbi:hypothetical protein H9Y04_27400 [Streptomyces sp. TRM66268-LWL]|uniref:ABC transporter n=1 Tax=Streptomyces polyasparticus TaxID=2767826 RepID=A0ABR7SLF8_9ACTN|nr:hypothetical protein [Streptomyces polyasparticus]MBC9716268.1 hypothetical protein [Streptomyces polyasparticus]